MKTNMENYKLCDKHDIYYHNENAICPMCYQDELMTTLYHQAELIETCASNLKSYSIELGFTTEKVINNR